MPNYRRPDGSTISVQFPDLNPSQVAGLTELDNSGNAINTPTPTQTPNQGYNFSRPTTPLETARTNYYNQFAGNNLPDEEAIRQRELKSREGLISGIEEDYTRRIREFQ